MKRPYILFFISSYVCDAVAVTLRCGCVAVAARLQCGCGEVTGWLGCGCGAIALSIQGS